MDVFKLSKEDCANLRTEIKFHQGFSHPNIIKFHDCLQVHNMVYLLIEFAQNGSLFPYIHPKDGLPELLALRFLYQTANGIKYLHDRKIIHRDLKPENLLLDESFNIKLCDFGYSCYLDENQVRTTICGTYEYMPPEIVNEKVHTHKVDIWGLGILLYEMLHGKAPFNASTFDQIKYEINSKKIVINKDIHEDTQNLIFKLLVPNEEDRYDIDSLLNHPALQKNLKEFQRPLTKNEYDVLLTNFYFSEYKVNPEELVSDLVPITPEIPKEEQNIVKIKIMKPDKTFQFANVKIPENLVEINSKIKGINTLIKTEYPVKKRLSASCLDDIKKIEKEKSSYPIINFSKNYFLIKAIIRLSLEARFTIHPSGRILLLERKCNWKEDFYLEEKQFGLEGKIFFIIYYDEVLENYKINSISVEGENNMVRKLIGKSFRGKKQKELEEITNMKDFISCHKSGLFAFTNSLHSAILVCDLSFS
jgi:serine/threonine protein kinase